jgi:hypothetical protein
MSSPSGLFTLSIGVFLLFFWVVVNASILGVRKKIQSDAPTKNPIRRVSIEKIL